MIVVATGGSALGTQVLTLAIPLGTFLVLVLIGYFARYRQR